MAKHDWFCGVWDFRLHGKGIKDWNLTKRNALSDEGEANILNSYFRDSAVPTEFYIGLANQAIIESSRLVAINTEPSVGGYARQLLNRDEVDFPLLEFVDGDYRIETKLITFAASGAHIGPVNTVFMATTAGNSGLLISYISLPDELTIFDGSSLDIKIRIKAM